MIEKEGEKDKWAGVHWWPTPGAGNLDPTVPADVGSFYDEAQRCLAVKADHAAVVMFGAVLAAIVADKGSPKARGKNTLYDQLKEMAAEKTLHPSMVEWAEEIRLLRNVGAHPIDHGPVSSGEAAELGRLTRQMIEVLYEVDARIKRRRQARSGSPTT